ncbi:MAG: LysR family transcriptional regulator [Plesiomonas sp.]
MFMKGVTANQLWVFQTIVQESSIRAAAGKLGIAPPSVSQALKQLETVLGLPLFTRNTRRMELTAAGLQLYQRTKPLLAELADAVDSVQDLRDQPIGHVSITLPRFVYQFFFRPIYAEFCLRYPQIQLEISISDATVDILRQGIDMGIRFGDRLEEGMVAHRLTPPMHDALFATADYLTRYGTPATPQALRQHKLVQYRFITSNQLAPVRLWYEDQSLVVDMPASIVVNDTDAVVDAALKGLGVGRIMQPIVADLLAEGRLLPVLEAHWHPYPGLYVYFPQHSQKTRRVRVLIDFLLEKSVR